jgi:hypothetical protein
MEKQFRFVTEDGVELFNKMDKVFEVIVANNHLNENMPLGLANELLVDKVPVRKRLESKIFRHKDNAMVFITNNKK